MKHLIALLFAFVTTFAVAGPIDNMAARCNEVMEQGVCRVVLDPRDYPNEKIFVVGTGWIKTSAYLAIRSAGIAKDAQGRFLMCEFIKKVCNDDWGGDECKAVRAMWRQD